MKYCLMINFQLLHSVSIQLHIQTFLPLNWTSTIKSTTHLFVRLHVENLSRTEKGQKFCVCLARQKTYFSQFSVFLYNFCKIPSSCPVVISNNQTIGSCAENSLGGRFTLFLHETRHNDRIVRHKIFIHLEL